MGLLVRNCSAGLKQAHRPARMDVVVSGQGNGDEWGDVASSLEVEPTGLLGGLVTEELDGGWPLGLGAEQAALERALSTSSQRRFTTTLGPGTRLRWGAAGGTLAHAAADSTGARPIPLRKRPLRHEPRGLLGAWRANMRSPKKS